MKADPAAQLRLLDLQAEDTAIAQLEHRRRGLPEHAQLAEARMKRAKLTEQTVAAQTEVADLQLEVEKAEADLVPVRERRARDQQRVDAGTLTDPKQLNAMIDEIAHLGKRISDLEDIELEVMERLEGATSARDESAAELAQLEDSMRAAIASRDAQLAEIDAERNIHQERRDQLAAGLPEALVGLYDRIRTRSGGLGAAALVGRRCSGCQLEATPIALTGYTSAPADEVIRCEECERILVRKAESV